MLGLRRITRRNRYAHPRLARVEGLETRRMLSAAGGPILHSDAIFMPSVTNSTVSGFSPSEIRHAYGFDQISFSNGAVAGDGQGQTVAIVDAFNDPNIAGDLAVFDTQFNLPAANLTVVNQRGGSTLPATDPGWAGEISLDVEWVHAIAPAAKIVLVEADSDLTIDLVSGVDFARHIPGVSVVSMSWGGSEFFSFNGGGEFGSQTTYDPIFTTPVGHQGITFVASSGDTGTFAGVQWPASSPNVLSVGGTSLTVSDAAGTYSNETSWNGSTGGFSQFEGEPAYQQVAQQGGSRSTPDVSYNGDPQTGFAVYDTIPYQGTNGWQVVGGTSAGAPQWAALLGIVNQGRTALGKDSLEGASQTLPLLYSLYPSAGGATTAIYENNFYDVVDNGSSNPFPWRFGGFGSSSNVASIGYDFATGLGSPKANVLVQFLATGNASSTPTPTPTPVLPPSPITGTLMTPLPTAVLGGSTGSLRLRLANTSGKRFNGPVEITLFASTDGSIANSTLITTLASNVSLGASDAKIETLKFKFPATLADGNYTLVASISTGAAAAPAKALTPAIQIKSAFVDVAASINGGQSVAVNPGKSQTVSVTIQNLGNVAASGLLGLNLYASLDQTLDIAVDQVLATLSGRRINLRPGKSMTLKVRFVAPAALAAGTYSLIAALTSTAQPADLNSSNDVAVVGTH